MKHSYSVQCGKLLLRPLCEEDIEFLRKWRNDASQTRFLRPIGYITPEMQKQWFENYLANDDEVVFAIVETQRLNRIVGSIALYDFSEDSAEIGKIQIGDPEAHGRGFGSLSIAMALQVAFMKLGRKRITASVNRNNIPSYRSFQKVGFTVVGNHPSVVGGTEDILEIDSCNFINSQLLPINNSI